MIEAGQTVVYRCTVYYFGSWTPTMQWTDPYGGAVKSRTHTNRTSPLKGYVTSVLMATATPTLDGTRLSCHVRWQAPHNLPAFYATNSLLFNMTVTTKGMTVLCKHAFLILCRHLVNKPQWLCSCFPQFRYSHLALHSNLLHRGPIAAVCISVTIILLSFLQIIHLHVNWLQPPTPILSFLQIIHLHANWLQPTTPIPPHSSSCNNMVTCLCTTLSSKYLHQPLIWPCFTKQTFIWVCKYVRKIYVVAAKYQ